MSLRPPYFPIGATRDPVDTAVRVLRESRERSVASFREYIPRVLPGFRFHYHTELLAETLERVVARDIRRLLVFAPPRHYKSLLISRLLPAYHLTRHPSSWVGLACSADPLPRNLSKDARGFYQVGGGTFRKDSKDATLWRTQFGGGMWARGIGGMMLGLGYHLGLVDDPFRDFFDACSVTVQEKVEDWFWNTFYNRRELTGGLSDAIVVMHQRLVEGDLAGRLLKREEESKSPEGWTILNLPAIQRKRSVVFPECCPVIPDRREDGEPLCPDLMSLEELEDLERKDAGDFAAKYQQDPQPIAGGGLFDLSWFQLVGDDDVVELIREWQGQKTVMEMVRELQSMGVLPEFDMLVRAWDWAASERTTRRRRPDATVCVLGGVESIDVGRTTVNRITWLDGQEFQVGPAKLKGLLTRFAEEDGSHVEVAIPQEPAAAGKYMTEDFQDALEDLGRMVHLIPQTGSKRARATPHAGAANAGHDGGKGRVFLLRAPFSTRFAQVHHRFDGLEGGEDDLVDAAANGFVVLDTCYSGVQIF